MLGSSGDERIVGGVDPRSDNVGAPIRLRVDDPLTWLNANWAGAMGNDVDRVPRKPGKAKPFCILGGVVMLLLATVGSEAWQAHVTPPIEQRIASLRELFADAMQVDCVGRDGNSAHQDQPACR